MSRKARNLAAYAAGVARLPTGRPIAVLASPRSGTELLMELLRGHPRVSSAGEMFATAPRRDPLSYVAGRAALTRIQGYHVWLFKLLFHRLMWFEESFGSAPAFLRGLLDRGFTLVVLERRNRLLQALSWIHGERTRYHFRGDGAAYAPLEVDPAEVVWAAHEFDTWATWGRAAVGDVPHIELSYEDDLASPERQRAAVERIFTAVGLEPHVPSTRLKRIAPPSVRARVTNYDDLAATLARTRFAGFLDD